MRSRPATDRIITYEKSETSFATILRTVRLHWARSESCEGGRESGHACGGIGTAARTNSFLLSFASASQAVSSRKVVSRLICSSRFGSTVAGATDGQLALADASASSVWLVPQSYLSLSSHPTSRTEPQLGGHLTWWRRLARQRLLLLRVRVHTGGRTRWCLVEDDRGKGGARWRVG
mgnify:CR=1 FL=1